MSYKTDSLERWDASHRKRIRVVYQEGDMDEVAHNDAGYYGVEVFTTLPGVADRFSANARAYTPHEITVKEVKALQSGDRVFYLYFGSHGNYAFRITKENSGRDWDGACCGILVVRRNRWPETIFANSYVYRKVKEVFEDRIMAVLNGWVFEAYVETGEPISECFSDCLSEEEALKAAQEEYPEIKYRPDQFEVTQTYRLVA